MNHDGMHHTDTTTTIPPMPGHGIHADEANQPSHTGSTHLGPGMHMAFYFGVENVMILFDTCVVNSAGQMVGACILFFILAIVYEGLKVYRETLLRRALIHHQHSQPRLIPSDTTEELSSNRSNTVLQPHATSRFIEPGIVKPVNQRRLGITSSPHFIQTLLHLMQVMLSYCLMLVVMTYNGYLILAVFFGAGLGYYVFGWKKSVIIDVEEHCQ